MNSTEETSSKETVLDAMNRIIEKEKKGVPLTAIEHLAMAGMAMSGIAGSIVQSGSSLPTQTKTPLIRAGLLRARRNQPLNTNQIYLTLEIIP